MTEKALITGGSGMLGNALSRVLTEQQVPFEAPSSKRRDFRDHGQTKACLLDASPDVVYHLAARVGGLVANSEGLADFYHDNAVMNATILNGCVKAWVPRVVSVLSTCVYPDAPFVKWPLSEEQLHAGPPHPSNFGYAFAKRMLDVYTRAIRKQHGLKYVTVIPNNIYGEHDNFDLINGHVIPSLMRRIWEARLFNQPTVTIWGNGKQLREFTYAEDIARILVVVSKEYDDDMPLNIGVSEEQSIGDVARLLAKYLGYTGELVFDESAPVGQFRKPSTNVRLLSMTSWKATDYTPFAEGLKKTCQWFMENYPNVRGVNR